MLENFVVIVVVVVIIMMGEAIYASSFSLA
jgi:hypothetical protein